MSEYEDLFKAICERGLNKESPLEIMLVHNVTRTPVYNLCGKYEYQILRELITDYLNLQSENAALRERLDKAIELPFYVFDKKTGKEADTYEIALNEDWAKHLMYCDMDGFAIEQDGTLVLIDECGQLAYCSSDRFEICTETRLKELQGEENG